MVIIPTEYSSLKCEMISYKPAFYSNFGTKKSSDEPDCVMSPCNYHIFLLPKYLNKYPKNLETNENLEFMRVCVCVCKRMMSYFQKYVFERKLQKRLVVT